MLIPVLLVAVVFRYREIQLQKERRLRIKIADDLHDEVGSSLTRIWHQASQAIPVMEQRKPLRAISEPSREAIATMSDIVWSIDARFDTLRDLIMRMKDYVYKLEDELEIMLSFSVKGKVDDKKVSQIVRQNLFLLFKEAINNAMKHGSGGEIAIRMEVYEQIMLQIVNRCNANSNSAGTDDTRSLSDASLCPVQGGRGLQNMRRRAANMHGTLNA